MSLFGEPSPVTRHRLALAEGGELAVEIVEARSGFDSLMGALDALGADTAEPEVSTELTFVWLSGYGSNMNGAKAQWLTRQCQIWGWRLVKFDFRATGSSSGDFNDVSLSDWVDDLNQVIKAYCPGGAILVGSSIGAWVALRAAEMTEAAGAESPIKALCLIAPAIDWTINYWNQLSEAEQAQCAQNGYLTLPHNQLHITHHFIKDAAANHAMLHRPIHYSGPVALLHGMADNVAPVQIAHTLFNKIQSETTTLTLIKNGDHALAAPEQLEFLWLDIVRLREAVLPESATE